MQIGIVADDLTGAADALAPFARRGFRAGVGFERKSSMVRFPLAEGDALAYDTATRDIARAQPDAIQNTVRRAARRLAELQARVLFKKIDSTLRGHLRLELDAMRAECADRIALICPAFPQQGRTVQSGVLHIHNIPWTQTEFAPAGMFASLTVRGAFGMDGNAGVAELGGADIRQSVEVLEARLAHLATQGVHTVFCDAAHTADLTGLAQTILQAPERYLVVGSAGLAHALADALPAPTYPAPVLQSLAQPFVNGRALVIVGSLHTASRRQAALLSERLEQAPILMEPGDDTRKSIERVVDEIRARYAAGQQVVVLTTPDGREADYAANFAWLPGGIARRACVSQLRAGNRIDGLIVCGGDTARELCEQCNGTGLQIEGEWQPGVALARLRAELDTVDNFSLDGLPILTKAGGFGNDQTLARCVGLL